MKSEETDQKKGFKDLLRELIVPKIERISMIILLLALLFKYLQIGETTAMIGIGLTTLAVTSYLYAFLYKTEGLMETLSIKLGHVACAVAIVGIMFRLMQLPGSATMLHIGAGALALSTVLVGYQLATNRTNLMKQATTRYLIVLVLTLITNFL